MRAYVMGLACVLAACSAAGAGNNEAADAPLSVAATRSDVAAVSRDAVSPKSSALPSPQNGMAAGASAIADTPALPAVVVAFKARRDECDHFRGEDPEDETRAAPLEKELTRTCKGTDTTLAGLRQRYAGNAAVIAMLADYDAGVE